MINLIHPNNQHLSSPSFGVKKIKAQKAVKFLYESGYFLKRIKGSHFNFFNPETKKTIGLSFHNKAQRLNYTQSNIIAKLNKLV